MMESDSLSGEGSLLRRGMHRLLGRSHREVVGAEVRLQLLKQDQDKGNLVLLF